MHVVEHIIQGAILLELGGKLDFSSRKEFLEAIQHATESDQIHVIVDLKAIRFKGYRPDQRGLEGFVTSFIIGRIKSI
jgi:hypothetical protein